MSALVHVERAARELTESVRDLDARVRDVEVTVARLEAAPPPLVSICSWCSEIIGTKTARASSPPTHGICRACAAKELAKARMATPGEVLVAPIVNRLYSAQKAGLIRAPALVATHPAPGREDRRMTCEDSCTPSPARSAITRPSAGARGPLSGVSRAGCCGESPGARSAGSSHRSGREAEVLHVLGVFVAAWLATAVVYRALAGPTTRPPTAPPAP